MWPALFAPIKRQNMSIHSEGIDRQKKGERRARGQRKRWRDVFVKLMLCSLSESLGQFGSFSGFCFFL